MKKGFELLLAISLLIGTGNALGQGGTVRPDDRGGFGGGMIGGGEKPEPEAVFRVISVRVVNGERRIEWKGWDETLESGGCAVTNQIIGREGGGAVECCPRQGGGGQAALQAMGIADCPPGQGPKRKLSQDELKHLTLPDGRKLSDSNCDAMVCDNDCDQPSPFPRDTRLDYAGAPGGSPFIPVSEANRQRGWAMAGGDDGKKKKDDDPKAKALRDLEKAVEREKQAAERAIAEKDRERAKAERQAADKKAPPEARKDAGARAGILGRDIEKLRREVADHNERLGRIRGCQKYGCRPTEDGQDWKEWEKFHAEMCQRYPGACPTKEEKLGQPRPDEDQVPPLQSHETAQFVCLTGLDREGGARVGERGNPLPQPGGGSPGRETGGAGCPPQGPQGPGGGSSPFAAAGDAPPGGGGGRPEGGGGRPEGGGGGGGGCRPEGAPPVVGDPLVNPGEFFTSCPEMDCRTSQGEEATLTMNSCPQGSTRGGREQRLMDCQQPIEWAY